nr:hypothetical protein CFP56_67500 [Quercus suber]
MGFGPLGTSCSLALKILSCHGNGDLLAWYLPFPLPGEGTWIALAVVDSLLLVELVLDLPTPSFLEVNSMLLLLMDPSLEATSGENLRFLSAMVVLETSNNRKKKRVIEHLFATVKTSFTGEISPDVEA